MFAFHARYETPYTLHCVDRKSKSIIWSADVRGLFHGGGSGNGFFHFVEMRAKGDAVYLFGRGFTGAYIQIYSLKDGKQISEFTTNYEFDPESHAIENR